MKQFKPLFAAFFIFSLYIHSILSAGNLTVVVHRGQIASVVINTANISAPVDLDESLSIDSGPISVGELDLIVFNNTSEASHNLELFTTNYDSVNNAYVIKNNFATIKLEVSKNFDFNGNTTSNQVITPTSNPFPLLSSNSTVQSSHKLQFNIVNSSFNLLRDGEYRTTFIIRFVSS